MAEELPDPDSAPYWEGIANGELRYQRCGACDAAIFYPRSICPACGTPDPQWQVSAGDGVVHAAEGFRMMSRVVDCDPDTVAIGQAVRAVYREDSDGKMAPYFAPAE
jgi:uncharacterized OB-fold protein